MTKANFDFKLDPKAKAKWIKALRSGKYEQGRGALKSDDKFCCLGVAVEEGLCGRSSRITSDYNQWVTLKFLPKNIQWELSNHNDGHYGVHRGFKWIANFIEKNL